MKAFRYLATHWIDTLRDRRFKLAKPSELNDPFDCVGAITGSLPQKTLHDVARNYSKSPEFITESFGLPRSERRKLSKQREKQIRQEYSKLVYTKAVEILETKAAVDKILRILCASYCEPSESNLLLPTEFSEILMWSHYADNHKGLRIGIDTSQLDKNLCTVVHKVNYSNDRPVYDLSQGEYFGSPEFGRELPIRKAKAWEYEHEIRILLQPGKCLLDKTDKGMPASFLPFSKDLIWRIDFGIFMPDRQQQECLSLLSQEYPNVAVYKASYHKTQYRIEYEPLIMPK